MLDIKKNARVVEMVDTRDLFKGRTFRNERIVRCKFGERPD